MRKKEVEEEGDTPSTISFLSAALRLRGDSDPTMMCGAAVNEKNWLSIALTMPSVEKEKTEGWTDDFLPKIYSECSHRVFFVERKKSENDPTTTTFFLPKKVLKKAKNKKDEKK